VADTVRAAKTASARCLDSQHVTRLDFDRELSSHVVVLGGAGSLERIVTQCTVGSAV
jgi:hypothetical protein